MGNLVKIRIVLGGAVAEWLGALVLSHKVWGFDPQQRRSPVSGLRQPTEVDSAALCGSENPKKRTLRFSGTKR